MKTFLIVIMVGFILFAAGESPAQTRIQFGKGKSSATVQGSTGANGMTYVVRARSGQKIALKLTPQNGVGIRVEINGRYGQTVLLREESGGSYEVGLEESGDYTIFIGSTNGKSKAFSLSVAITKMTDI